MKRCVCYNKGLEYICMYIKNNTKLANYFTRYNNLKTARLSCHGNQDARWLNYHLLAHSI